MLEVHELSKRYGDVVALDGCSFVVPEGKMVGFLGPNGAGKTTTMRAVFGLVEPDRGTILWRGQPVGPAAWQRFGYMPEERGLYPKMRVRDQVVHFGRLSGLSASAAGAAADRWLERLGLGDRGNAKLDELSHGNQQRVQLAVALAHDPELLVLDEPFSGLDPLAVDALSQLMHDLTEQGRTVLFSSHQLDLVEDLCEDVVTINRGAVVLEGRLEELRAKATHRRLEITLAGAHDDDWVPDLPGAQLVERRDGHVRLEVERDIDLGAVLDSVRTAGEIVRFDFDPPTLSELFRDAVTR